MSKEALRSEIEGLKREIASVRASLQSTTSSIQSYQSIIASRAAALVEAQRVSQEITVQQAKSAKELDKARDESAKEAMKLKVFREIEEKILASCEEDSRDLAGDDPDSTDNHDGE